jgi:hypothetical protein
VKSPVAAGIALIVTVAVANGATVPIAHVAPVHEPWLGVDDTRVNPAGSVSVTVTFVAVAGPSLLTVSV